MRVVRLADPARARPVTARASVGLAGATVHAHVDAVAPREAADLLIDRIDRRIARLCRTHRGDRGSGRAARLVPGTTPADGRQRVLPVPPTSVTE